MENIPINEASCKWRAKLQKWTKRIIVLGVIYGLLWLFLPLSCSKINLEWSNMNLGEHKTMKDVYHVNIGGITYAKDKFYILLNKPYLFKNYNGYVYSSKDLGNWSEEASGNNFPLGTYSPAYSFYNFDDYMVVESSGHTLYKRFNNDVSNYLLPRNIDGNCYIVSRYGGYISKGCLGNWTSYSYLTNVEFNTIRLQYPEKNNTEDSIDGVCSIIKSTLATSKIIHLAKFFCLPRLPNQNILAYKILNKIIQDNMLGVYLDSSYYTYGDGKYVGVFYKNKQYYFIISTDGVHYEIKPAPSDLVSSVAIKLFN